MDVPRPTPVPAQLGHTNLMCRLNGLVAGHQRLGRACRERRWSPSHPQRMRIQPLRSVGPRRCRQREDPRPSWRTRQRRAAAGDACGSLVSSTPVSEKQAAMTSSANSHTRCVLFFMFISASAHRHAESHEEPPPIVAVPRRRADLTAPITFPSWARRQRRTLVLRCTRSQSRSRNRRSSCNSSGRSRPVHRRKLHSSLQRSRGRPRRNRCRTRCHPCTRCPHRARKFRPDTLHPCRKSHPDRPMCTCRHPHHTPPCSRHRRRRAYRGRHHPGTCRLDMSRCRYRTDHRPGKVCPSGSFATQVAVASSQASVQSVSMSPTSPHGSPVELPHTPLMQVSVPLQNMPSLHAAPSGSCKVQSSAGSLQASEQSSSPSGRPHGSPSLAHVPARQVSAPVQN